MRGGGHSVVENLLGKTLLRWHKRPNAAAQLAVFLDGYKRARAALHQFLRQFCGKRQIGMCPHKMLDTHACKPHIIILRRTQFGNRPIFRTHELRREVIRLVPTCHGERGNGIPHTKWSFVAVQICIHRRTVEHTREHPQTVQPAMPRRLGKTARNLQEREEIPCFHECRAEFVKLRALGCKAVCTALHQTV